MARMKKREQQSKGDTYEGSKVFSCKMLSRASTSTSSKKRASRKMGGSGASSNVKKGRKSNTQPKFQRSKYVENSLVVNKEEEFIIEDFDSQELLQDAPVKAGGDSGAINRPSNSRKVGSPKENNKWEREMNSSKVEGMLPGAGSSKTVVINSQPQFAPSQLDEDCKVLEEKPKNCKRGILKRVVCSSKSLQESVPQMNSKRRYQLLEEELSVSSVSREHHEDDCGMSSNFPTPPSLAPNSVYSQQAQYCIEEKVLQQFFGHHQLKNHQHCQPGALLWYTWTKRASTPTL